jgi:hypothetical protein
MGWENFVICIYPIKNEANFFMFMQMFYEEHQSYSPCQALLLTPLGISNHAAIIWHQIDA